MLKFWADVHRTCDFGEILREFGRSQHIRGGGTMLAPERFLFCPARSPRCPRPCPCVCRFVCTPVVLNARILGINSVAVGSCGTRVPQLYIHLASAHDSFDKACFLSLPPLSVLRRILPQCCFAGGVVDAELRCVSDAARPGSCRNFVRRGRAQNPGVPRSRFRATLPDFWSFPRLLGRWRRNLGRRRPSLGRLRHNMDGVRPHVGRSRPVWDRVRQILGGADQSRGGFDQIGADFDPRSSGFDQLWSFRACRSHSTKFEWIDITKFWAAEHPPSSWPKLNRRVEILDKPPRTLPQWANKPYNICTVPSVNTARPLKAKMNCTI